MRKNIFKLLLLLFLLPSCDGFLTRYPLNELSPETFFQEISHLPLWNASIYDAFQRTLNQGQINWGEVRSDNVHDTGYTPDEYYYNALIASNANFSWENLYKCINLCNIAIEKYPTIPGALLSDYGSYLGQAYAMRAYMYFFATRTWGRVPLIVETWDGDVDNVGVPRSSLESIKEQIFSDITEALNYIGNTVPTKRNYISVAMVYALKVDAHMWYQEYQDALDTSDYFIDNNDVQLAQDEKAWKEIFTNPANSKEVIFYMSWDYAEKGNSNHGWGSRFATGNNHFKISQDLFNEFLNRNEWDNEDFRFRNTLDIVEIEYELSKGKVSITEAGWSTNQAKRCMKYCEEDPDKEFDSENEVYKTFFKKLQATPCEIEMCMYRLSDILLLRAEALNHLQRGAEALEIVNMIRSRSGYLVDAMDDLTMGMTTRDIEWLILKERQLELFGEGRRWFDLMRTGRLLEVMDPVYSKRQGNKGSATGFGHEGRKYCPIYYREFEANPALRGDQNEPYSEG